MFKILYYIIFLKNVKAKRKKKKNEKKERKVYLKRRLKNITGFEQDNSLQKSVALSERMALES